MHKEKAWLLFKHMAVNCIHLNSILPQCFDYRINFATQQNKISGDCSFSSSGRLEIHACCKSHGTGDCHSGLSYLLCPRSHNLVHPTIHFSLMAESLIDSCSVQINFWRG